MPFINQGRRNIYKKLFKDIHSDIKILEKGDLEYLVFKLMLQYMEDKEIRYSTLHDTVYAVIHAAEEFKRLYLDKREDQAIDKNGKIK